MCRRKMEMKNLKKMWEVIAAYILENYKLKYTTQTVKTIDVSLNETTRNILKIIVKRRGRKYFEFAKEMDEIFGKKRNIHPEIQFTSSGTIKSKSGSELEITKIETPESEISVQPLIETQTTSPRTPTLKRSF